mmetsp:Transcript_62311/g.184375  ORF Transcript_62311/g.184375 Transcript_62311/m.184375 type:complete len:246 (-) Transcript_62311:226-963(-)
MVPPFLRLQALLLAAKKRKQVVLRRKLHMPVCVAVGPQFVVLFSPLGVMTARDVDVKSKVPKQRHPLVGHASMARSFGELKPPLVQLPRQPLVKRMVLRHVCVSILGVISVELVVFRIPFYRLEGALVPVDVVFSAESQLLQQLCLFLGQLSFLTTMPALQLPYQPLAEPMIPRDLRVSLLRVESLQLPVMFPPLFLLLLLHLVRRCGSEARLLQQPHLVVRQGLDGLPVQPPPPFVPLSIDPVA